MYKPGQLPESIVRRRVTGTLTTESPLHIGDGDRGHVSKRECGKKFLEGADPEYSTVATDFSGRPVIPGTSIKGSLLAWAVAHGFPDALVKAVFGTMEGGGIVTFHDARLQDCVKPVGPEYRLWSDKRSTALSPQVAINPRTRSADEHLLYYVEYVPAGARFEVSCTMQGASDAQLGLLLDALENAFASRERPARLGGDVSNGWGKVQWKFRKLLEMDPKAWLDERDLRPWHEALEEVALPAREKWAGLGPKAPVRLRLALDFQGAMLINDPSRQRKGDQPIGHASIRKEDGSVYLPAQSVRGALRAQARRIWQTLAWDNERQDLNLTRHLDARQKRDVTELAAFLRLFGATGWRAPIEVEDFQLEGREIRQQQEFVAVDRFTGGAAAGKKFNAHGLWRPKFTGVMRIRVDRLEKSGAGEWVWMLLAYTLRDWMEGDGTIGFGASKGYGAFRASVAVEGDSAAAQTLRGILGRDAAELQSAELDRWAQSLERVLDVREVA